MKLISCILLCFALLACGNEGPLDPLAADKEDQAIEKKLAGLAAYLLVTHEDMREIVYWRFLADGRYQFRQTALRQYRLWESGTWWVRDGILFLERTAGALWRDGDDVQTERKPYYVQISLVGPSLEDAHWVVIHGHEYRLADAEDWQEVTAAFFEE